MTFTTCKLFEYVLNKLDIKKKYSSEKCHHWCRMRAVRSWFHREREKWDYNPIGNWSFSLSCMDHLTSFFSDMIISKLNIFMISGLCLEIQNREPSCYRQNVCLHIFLFTKLLRKARSWNLEEHTWLKSIHSSNQILYQTHYSSFIELKQLYYSFNKMYIVMVKIISGVSFAS